MAPDFGPAEFVPTWGATMVGARKFVVSYSVNLLCSKELAQELAKLITEVSGCERSTDRTLALAFLRG